jgi:hypothetical protein
MADRRADDTPLAPHRPLAKGSRDEGRERTSSAAKPTSGQTPAGTGGREARPAPAAGPVAPAGATSVATAATRPAGAQQRPRGTRRARLRLVHLDPWSVMKTAFLLSIAFGIVAVVAVAVVWSVLGAAGVWDSINKTVTDVLGGDSAQNFDVRNYVGTSRVLGFTMFVAVVDVVLITAISTLGAFLYNLAAALLGGVEVTLAEDER